MKTQSQQRQAAKAAEPSPSQIAGVIREAEAALAVDAEREAAVAPAHPPDVAPARHRPTAPVRPPRKAVRAKRTPKAGAVSPKKKPVRSTKREAAQTAVGIAGGEVGRRTVVDAIDRKKVIDVARHVASKKCKEMTDAQVLQFVCENEGFRKSLAGHLHEQLDAADLKKIYELRKQLHMSEGRWLKLYAEHNRKGLDGAYKGARKAGDACFTQHKLSENPQQLKKAASKVNARVRGKTELVVGRGTKVDAKTAKGLKGVREAGRSVKDVRGIVEKAADPTKVTRAGTQAAQKLTLKAGAGAALIGAGLSVATDVSKLRKGEISGGEVAENAAWAGGEAAICTLATAGVTAAAAPTIAAGTAALAASSVAGTTAMAAGLATLGPIGLGIGIGIGIGFGVKKLRKAVRDN